MMKNPWKGLASYEESDINRYKFCGRNRSIGELTSLVINNLFVTLYGRTGIGKTSLLKAGVFPLLRANNYLPVLIRFSETDDWFSDVVIREIESAVAEIRVNEFSKVTEDRVDDLWEYFATRHFYNAAGVEVYPVIVLDQFEENFLRSGQKRKVELLLEQLYSLIDDNKIFPDGYHNETNFRMVLSIREDDLFRLEDSVDSLKLLEFKYNRYRLVSLTDDEARDIIEVPGEELLPTDESERTALIADILGQIKKGDEESLSTLMLSLVCSQLFERAVAVAGEDRPKITQAVISSMEGNGLKEFYLRIVKESLPEAERYALEDLLVDESGRRNSVNDTVFKRRVPSWRKLTEGADRILQTTNGKVELVHDMLAAAIFEVRLERQKEEREKDLARIHHEEVRSIRIKIMIFAIISFLIMVLALYIGFKNNALKEANQKMLVAQSRAVANMANRLIEDGDSFTATKILLDVLPSHLGQQTDGAYTSDAENALRTALNHRTAILSGHTGYVVSVAFSPDGKKIVSGSADNTIRIWDADTGAQLGEPLVGHADGIRSVAFSPSGTRIASGSGDRTIRIWDADTGAQIGEPLVGHTNIIWSIAFSPDGKRIASASEDQTIRIWNTETGEQIGKPLVGHTGGIGSVSFSPDGKRIVSGSDDNTIRIWDAETGMPIGKPLAGHSNNVVSVSYSPDGKQIVSGSADETICIWDAETGKQIGEPFVGHTNGVMSVVFSPDGERVVSGSADGTIRIWDAKKGEQIGKPRIGHTGIIYSVAISPNGKHLVSGSWDGTLRIWEVETGDSVGDSFIGHTTAVLSVAFSPDGKKIASASEDQTIRIWNVKTGEQIGEPLVGHTGMICSVAFSPDGKRIVSGSDDNTIRIWDTETGVQIGEPFVGHVSKVMSVAFSPDGKRIASASFDGTIRIWDAETGAETCEPLVEHFGGVLSVVFSPDGKKLASGSTDQIIRIWDAETGEHIQRLLNHTKSVVSVAFSPDGKRLVSGSADQTIRMWNVETGTQTGAPLVGHADAVLSVAFSPDGKRFASASSDGTIRVWDAGTGAQLGRSVVYPTNYIGSVSFSPDGRKIVAGFDDGVIRIWEWKPLQELMDEARERFKNRHLTSEERRKYYLE